MTCILILDFIKKLHNVYYVLHLSRRIYYIYNIYIYYFCTIAHSTAAAHHND